MVSSQTLNTNPVYLLTVLTFISFVVAALREELWRTFTLTAADKVLPRRWSARGRAVVALVVTSMIFGMGHYAVQGLLGVGITTVLGLVLGFAVLQQRSIWPAVIAHGLFDASTFLILAFTDLATKVK
jgi:membrane protease YdiL (CAAX protease family)